MNNLLSFWIFDNCETKNLIIKKQKPVEGNHFTVVSFDTDRDALIFFENNTWPGKSVFFIGKIATGNKTLPLLINQMETIIPDFGKVFLCNPEQQNEITATLKSLNNTIFVIETHDKSEPESAVTHLLKRILFPKKVIAERTLSKCKQLSIPENNKFCNDVTTPNVSSDKIISVISHDMKDPLLSLVGITDILIANWKNFTDDEKLDIIRDIHYTSESTYKLLTDLVDWCRRQMKNPVPNFQLFDANDALNSVVQSISRRAQWKNIQIRNLLEPDLTLYADENMIVTIFRNLLTNAVKANKQAGFIDISALMDGEMCQFCFRDSGIGMSSIQVSELFSDKNRYSREYVFSTNPGGLGLILCKDFVEINKGRIWAESQPGKGTRIFFTVPLHG